MDKEKNIEIEYDSDMASNGCSLPSMEDRIDIDDVPEVDSVLFESTSESDQDDIDENLTEQIRDLTIQFKLPLNAVHAMLAILKPHHPKLPLDHRTLLKTPRVCDVKQLSSGGEYCHLGLRNGITNALKGHTINVHLLELQFNVDGLPLFKSSSTNLWPILCMICNIPNCKPFVVGLFCGINKPGNVAEFLSDFIKEFRELQETGLVIDDMSYHLNIHSFICDAPARSFLKCIKAHSGYFACEKCNQKGEYIGKVIFPLTDAPLRTDESFYTMDQEEHHNTLSPLTSLGVGLVSKFGLDYMHMVCLGTVRRILLYWKGPVSPKHARLGRQYILDISSRLVSLKGFVPSDFSRKPRALQEILCWKATEFRQFLLYTGVIVLKGILPANLYNHFVLLSSAIRILADPNLAKSHCEYAHELLIGFVKDAEKLYGKDILVYNVHGLVHISLLM